MALVHFSRPFDPINALLNLQQEFDRVFDNPRGFDLGLSGRGAFPPMNVFSDADGYTVRMEIPGVAPENVAIEATAERSLSVASAKLRLQKTRVFIVASAAVVTSLALYNCRLTLRWSKLKRRSSTVC